MRTIHLMTDEHVEVLSRKRLLMEALDRGEYDAAAWHSCMTALRKAHLYDSLARMRAHLDNARSLGQNTRRDGSSW